MNSFSLKILLVFMLFGSLANSQDGKIDSLTNVLSTSKEDTNKVNVLLNISDAYRSINNAFCLDYAEKAITLAQKINYERGLMRGFLRKASSLSKAGDNESAIKELQKGEKLFTTGKFSKHLPEIVMRKGYIEWKSKKYDEALATFTKADSVYQTFRKTKGYESMSIVGSVECAHVIARIYAAQGQYSKAIESCDRGIDLAEKNKEWSSAGDAYSILGNIFLQQQNYDKALECYKMSLEYAKQGGNERMVVGGYLAIGNCYFYKRDYDKAKASYLECLVMQEKTNDALGTAYVVYNLGEIEVAKKNYEEAIKYGERGLILSEKLKDPLLLMGSHRTLSEALTGLGKYDLALKHALKAVQLAEQLGDRENEYKTKNNLSKVYFGLGKYKEAYLYRDSSATLKDTLTSIERTKLSLELEEKFEDEKKENEIKLQKLDLQMKDSEIATGKKQKMAIIGILFLVVIFLLILFNRFKVTTKQKEIITKQKVEVEEQKHQLQEKQKEILDSINYAQKIQGTLIANHEFVNRTIPDSFVFFRPKDIVSGDFYWATSVMSEEDFEVFGSTEKKQKVKSRELFYLAVCDSTGHGVPGAFMSLLNISFLNEAIKEKHIHAPNKVFDFVRQRLIHNMGQGGRSDGMDGILMCIDKSNNSIYYVGSNNAPMLVSSDGAKYLPTDKMPVGLADNMEPFKLFEIKYKKGDMLHLCTDGYADQFGGPEGKKFKTKKLNQLLTEIFSLPLPQQEEALIKNFNEWKGKQEQVDDVCILGIRL